MKKTILAAGMAVVLFMTGCGSAVSQQPDSQQSVVAETATGSENASGSTVSANESTSQSMGSSTAAGGPQGYGGIVWATDSEQAKHESFVLVPEYPDVVLDDHNGYTTTEYLEMTVRLLKSVEDKYSVDIDRIYATGQSVGCTQADRAGRSEVFLFRCRRRQ
jgi:hypothetical protein